MDPQQENWEDLPERNRFWGILSENQDHGQNFQGPEELCENSTNLYYCTSQHVTLWTFVESCDTL